MAVARTFAAANAHRLRAWLSGQRIGAAHAGFMRMDEDLVLSCGPVFIERAGSSGSVAAALAMCQLIYAYKSNGVAAVTGDLDLRGNLKPVQDLRLKLHEARRAGAKLFVYPQDCQSRLEQEWAEGAWTAQEREIFAELARPANTFDEVLALTVRGLVKMPDVRKQIDGPHVGVGRCTGFEEELAMALVEFQACWSSPGRSQYIFTGNMSQATCDRVVLLSTLIRSQTATLRGLFQKSDMSLERRGADLHVHSSFFWEPVPYVYQTGALYIALVSLMAGRRPRRDTAIFGEVTDSGQLIGDWDWSLRALASARKFGLTRVVLAPGIKVGEEVERAAMGGDEEDGASRVEVIHTNTIIEALPFVFWNLNL